MENASHSLSVRSEECPGALHVTDVARRADVTPATVRYYARIGLLNPARDDQNGYRRFNHEDLHRLQFIRKAQALGLTIADIRLILERIDERQPVCDQVVCLLRARLEGVRRAQLELEATQARIEQVLRLYPSSVDSGADYCSLIEQAEI